MSASWRRWSAGACAVKACLGARGLGQGWLRVGRGMVLAHTRRILRWLTNRQNKPPLEAAFPGATMA